MTEFNVEILLIKAKALYADVTPRIIHDNGVIFYLTPDEFFEVRMKDRIAERKINFILQISSGETIGKVSREILLDKS